MPGDLEGLNDSTQLTAARREKYFAVLTSRREIRFGIAQITAEVVDAINILQASTTSAVICAMPNRISRRDVRTAKYFSRRAVVSCLEIGRAHV